MEARLAPISANLSQHLQAALQHLASQSNALPSTVRFLYGRERIEGESNGPATHWQHLITGRLDRSFAEAAGRTGQRHARLGVDPRWHAGTHAIVADMLIRGVIRDGMAAALRPRRGPLGMLGAPDPSAALDAAEAMASGLATLVSAIVLDLDLTLAGYVDKLRQDAEARLEAQREQLRRAVEQAGRVLALAAEGRRDDTAAIEADPELAALHRGAETLADRVAGLVDDLVVAGEAARALASDVLEGGKVLVEERLGQADAAAQLDADLARQAPVAAGLSSGLGDLARHAKSVSRRSARGRRDLDAARAALQTQDGADGLAVAGLDGLARLFDRLSADMAAELEILNGLQHHGAQLADALAQSREQAAQLRKDLVSDAEQGAEVERTIRQALAGAGGLVELAEGLDAVPVPVEPRPIHPAFDQTAMAAHWHAV